MEPQMEQLCWYTERNAFTRIYDSKEIVLLARVCVRGVFKIHKIFVIPQMFTHKDIPLNSDFQLLYVRYPKATKL